MADRASSTPSTYASRHQSPHYVPPGPPAFVGWARAMIADGWRFIPRGDDFAIVPTPAVPCFQQWVAATA